MNRFDAGAQRNADFAPGRLAMSLAALFAVAAPTLAHAQATPAQPPPTEGSVLLEADTVTQNDKAQTIIAEGNVEARYQGRVLRTDRLTYSLRDKTIHAQGKVQITDPDGSVRFADEIEVDDQLNTGVATNFSTRFQPAGVAAASSAVRPSEGRNELYRVVYTACPICTADGKPANPFWRIRARRAVQDQNSKMISYRDFVLQIGPVPVLYLPYFSHPDPSSGPRTGLLPPDFGSNRRLGAYYEQPIHITISPYQDLTLSPQLHEKVNPLLGFTYRKRFYSGSLQFNGSVVYDREFGDDGYDRTTDEMIRGHIFGEGAFEIDEDWSWGFGVERTTDDLYLRRYDIEEDERPKQYFYGDYTRLVSQAYANRQTLDSFSSVSVVTTQGLRAEDRVANLPLIAPFAEAEQVITPPVVGGRLKLQASSAQVIRDGQDTANEELTDTARVSVGADWRRDTVVGPGLVASAFAQARGDFYQVRDGVEYLDDGSSRQRDASFTRGVGVVGLETRYPFMRAGKTADITIEPIVMAAVGTDKAQDDRLCLNVDQGRTQVAGSSATIPNRICNEDSLAFELDESSLFRPNAAPNFDVFEPGPRLSAGLQATARSHDGTKRASALIGRRWRETAEPTFSRASNLDRTASDYVGAVTAQYGPRIGADVRFRVAEQDRRLQRLDAGARFGVWRLDVSGRYFKVEDSLRPNGDPTEEVSYDGSFRISKRWTFGFGERRDLSGRVVDDRPIKILSQNARLLYTDDCTYFELSYERRETFDRILGPDEGIRFRFGLKSLGELSGS